MLRIDALRFWIISFLVGLLCVVALTFKHSKSTGTHHRFMPAYYDEEGDGLRIYSALSIVITDIKVFYETHHYLPDGDLWWRELDADMETAVLLGRSNTNALFSIDGKLVNSRGGQIRLIAERGQPRPGAKEVPMHIKLISPAPSQRSQCAANANSHEIVCESSVP
jgi:hypothetical protein